MSKQPAKISKKKGASKQGFTCLLVVSGAVILFSLATFNLDHFLDKQAVLGSSTEISGSRKEIAFWEAFLYENEDYLDGWYELARLRLDEGDIVGANKVFVEIERINPNSEILQTLKNPI